MKSTSMSSASVSASVLIRASSRIAGWPVEVARIPPGGAWTSRFDLDLVASRLEPVATVFSGGAPEPGRTGELTVTVANTGVDQGLLFQAAQAAGFAGVDVFFVISGFIMYHTTVKANGPGASLDFLKRRAARIYSGYWPFFILAAIVFAWARPAHFEASNLLTSFLLWPAPLHEVLLDVSWTLSYEMYFYGLFTAMILLPLREVPDRLSKALLRDVLGVLVQDLRTKFGIEDPQVLVCGLNPHAGEDGHLGGKEQQVMIPLLERLRGEVERIGADRKSVV